MATRKGSPNHSILDAYLNKRRLSENSVENYGNAMGSFDMIVDKPLGDAGPEDFERWYDGIKERYRSSTILLYAKLLKQVYQFALIHGGTPKKEAKILSEEALEEIPFADLKRAEKKENKLRDQLVRPGEFEALMRGAKHPRVQALISVLYDSACRKGEVLGLRIRDVDFRDEGYILIRVEGKTGERSIPLTTSIPFLKAWLAIHPDRDSLDAPLFATYVKGRIRALDGRALNTRLSRICKKMGIRNINPHMLRHTRLTDLAKGGAGEYQLKSFAGWTPDSRMAARYIHMAGDAHVNAILSLQGYDVENGKENGISKLLGLTRCPNCNQEAGQAMTFCPNCGYVLDAKLRIEKATQPDDTQPLKERIATLEEKLTTLTNFLETWGDPSSPETLETFRRLEEMAVATPDTEEGILKIQEAVYKSKKQ